MTQLSGGRLNTGVRKSAGRAAWSPPCSFSGIAIDQSGLVGGAGACYGPRMKRLGLLLVTLGLLSGCASTSTTDGDHKRPGWEEQAMRQVEANRRTEATLTGANATSLSSAEASARTVAQDRVP